jgi:curved DNA-binding protein CbpA
MAKCLPTFEPWLPSQQIDPDVSTQDHYATLGVLPDAEEIVITAAYRALAQRYHPDRWTGDKDEGHRRMCRINEAYETIGNRAKRAEYDKTRSTRSQQEFSSDDAQDYSEAFSSALKDIEERWLLACSIYPDLASLRSGLTRISTSLAFAYVNGLLELKTFDKRHELAAHLERNFLTRYFGNDERILQYARKLILDGNKAAAKALNKLVDVMGSGIDASLLIAKIDEDFGFRRARDAAVMESQKRNRLDWLIHAVRSLEYYKEARELANLRGYECEETGGGIFSSPSVRVKNIATGETLQFKNPTAFVAWAKNALCSGL